MSFDIDIIDKFGNTLPESSELYFNYLRNPFGFHKFLEANFGVNIREYPFFPRHTDYDNFYPSQSQKLQMKMILDKIILELPIKKRLIWLFEDKRTLDQFFPNGLDGLRYFTDDRKSFFKIIIPKKDEPENLNDLTQDLQFFFSEDKCLCGIKGCKEHSVQDIINYNNLSQINKQISRDIDLDYYRDWIRKFEQLINLLIQEGNGYYISS